MKEYHPIKMDEFAKSWGIDKEPAFSWWIPYTLLKRGIVISAINDLIQRTTHKYGIEIPGTVKHAHELYLKNENGFWVKTIEKEMINVAIAFKILDKSKSAPVGWSMESWHLIFDVKMEFTRNARWNLDSHGSANPNGSTYDGVVSRDSVSIALTYSELNDIELLASDIKNAYIQAP